MKTFLLGCVAAFALATAAIAAPISPDQIAQFKVGIASAPDVVAGLGHPMSDQTSSDGSHIMVYSSTRTHAKLASFVPVVGLFAGGATGSVQTVVFNFGADGLLKSTSTNLTTVDCSMRVVTVDCSR
jgi:hypothetical protein